MLFGLKAFVATSLALAAIQAGAVVHKRSSPPNSKTWVERGPADDASDVTFSFSLRGEKMHELEARMLDISRSRGSWLSHAEARYFAKPSPQAVSRVHEFLAEAGVARHEISSNGHGDVLTVRTNAGTAGRLFKTRMYDYAHLTTGQVSRRSASYELPDDIADHVVHVRGLVDLVEPKARAPVRGGIPKTPNVNVKRAPAEIPTASSARKSSRVFGASRALPTFHATDVSAPTGPSSVWEAPPGCVDSNSSFACISRFYGTDTYTPVQDSESLAIISYGAWQDISVLSFDSLHRPDAEGYLPNKAYLGDPNGLWDNPTADDGEAIIDVDCAIGMAYGLNLTVYQSGVDYLGNIEELIALDDESRPGVVSFSYGAQETDFTRAYAEDFCNKVQILASMGTTFLTGSGDNGVSINDEKTCPPFAVDMQSACPYVVGVGGTAFNLESETNPERAGFEPSLPDDRNGWSSGGFSNYFDIPSYQKASHAAYLKKINNKYSQYYNVSGRGFPDISALGTAVNIVQTSEDGVHEYLAGGTSAAAPIWASVLALVNAKCKAAGKARVGWVHPTLYANTEAVNDITLGGSQFCDNPGDNPYGFAATTAWDPASGLGSPNFPKLVSAFGCD